MNPDDTIPCPPPSEARDTIPSPPSSLDLEMLDERGVCGFLGPYELDHPSLDE